jgi:hypothetical protein
MPASYFEKHNGGVLLISTPLCGGEAQRVQRYIASLVINKDKEPSR